MSEPTNLGRARKRKARVAKERAATANRLRDGQTKADRTLRAKREAERARRLAGARLDPPDER